MFYLTEAHIKPPRPKMTKEEAREFLAKKRAYYRSYPDEYPIPLSRNTDYQAWVRWAKANTL